MKLRIARLALNDLAEIRLSSKARWGSDRTRRYLRAIDEAMQKAADRPLQYPAVDELPRFRRIRAGQHLVFFVVNGDVHEVGVVRVLHERMDVLQYLSADG